MLADSLGVSEFIELVNQTFDLVWPAVSIIGELANFKISKNKWLYFDLKDETSSLKFFGTVYSLSGPLEDGMMLKVSCTPKLHNTYGFSMQVLKIELVGEGSLKRSAELLQIKLSAEGLFDIDKKRSIAYPPSTIGLITSSQSAAYYDFKNIINNRWRGLNISLIDVQVQGDAAINQIAEAFKYFNDHADEYDVVVLIRGGGSPEDLAVFNSEVVTRLVASSKVPTLVAIGHEIDICLAELAADKRASTPSHAAELLVPDKNSVLKNLTLNRRYLNRQVEQKFINFNVDLNRINDQLKNSINSYIRNLIQQIDYRKQLLSAYDPNKVLRRGYSIVRKKGNLVRDIKTLELNDILDIQLANGKIASEIKAISKD